MIVFFVSAGALTSVLATCDYPVVCLKIPLGWPFLLPSLIRKKIASLFPSFSWKIKNQGLFSSLCNSVDLLTSGLTVDIKRKWEMFVHRCVLWITWNCHYWHHVAFLTKSNCRMDSIPYTHMGLIVLRATVILCQWRALSFWRRLFEENIHVKVSMAKDFWLYPRP